MVPILDPARRQKCQTLQTKLVDLLKIPVALTITDNVHSIISVKRQPSGMVLRLHFIFLEATEAVLIALTKWALGPRRRINQVLQLFIDQNQEKIAKSWRPRKPRRIKLIVQGRYFHLQEPLQRLQQEYFNPDPDIKITWGNFRKRPGRTKLRLGSYSSSSKIIRINPLLDRSFVPQYVLDDVIFHEILHHHLGLQEHCGRTFSHHAAFKKLEKEFPYCKAAKAWIKIHLQRLVKG
jgi:predicted metal-dependent hydrolase